jgi:hypothetical protein
MIDLLAEGMPEERLYQTRSLLNEVTDRCATAREARIFIPVAREAITSIHPDRTDKLADKLVTFCREDLSQLPRTMWFYGEFSDWEVAFIEDLAAQFIREWDRSPG